MKLTLQIAESLDDVPAEAWDALAGSDDPFVEHAFLRSLEASGSVGPEAGWAPCHVLARDASGALVGAAPLYLKNHSYGEYIFDWAWANAATQAGLPYYPKLTCAVPFTPATGRRLLVRPGAPEAPILRALAQGMAEVAEQSDASSTHVLFLTEGEQRELTELGMMPRLTFQYHWVNELGWATMDDFLGAFRSSARKKVRRERRDATASGLAISTKRGTDLTDTEWGALYACYRDTVAKKGAYPYLTEAFFHEVRAHLPHRLVAAIASDHGRPVAAAFGFRKGKHLYGRYWGTLTDCDFLHFELCYYQFIEYALSEGCTRFEAGAQGEHKIARGLLPTPTYSAHWIRHPGLRQAIAEYLPREAWNHQREMEWLSAQSPFRRE
jgi:predicted N-acyltransferase